MDEFQTISVEEADQLTIENQGWAESIARSVARAWNLDWKLDGLDGAALEALLFCARRFQPGRGVPFRGYARRRIHEASTEQAKKSRGWRKAPTEGGSAEARAREISAKLFDVFPELHEGELPFADDGGGGDRDPRAAIRYLVIGASLIAGKESYDEPSPDELVDIKRMVTTVATLEAVHQLLIYKVYWDGLSLRNVAAEWETDGLNVIREHKVLLAYLQKSIAAGKKSAVAKPKIRPGLRPKAIQLKKEGNNGPFTNLIQRTA